VKQMLDRLTQRAAEESSRRGFLSNVAKLTLGAAAVATGLAKGVDTAHADGAPLYCCTTTACSGNVCPAGSSFVGGWQWYCCDNTSCIKYLCKDCVGSHGGYFCTVVSRTNLGGCAC
jgi:hypothetical protein